MTTPTPSPVATGTVTLHRVLRAPTDRIYRAFLDADAMCKWLPPHGFTGRVLSLDARVGGSYRMQFTNFSNGQSHSFGGTYVELKPNELLRYTDRFDDPNLPGEMMTTVTLKAVSCGVELRGSSVRYRARQLLRLHNRDGPPLPPRGQPALRRAGRGRRGARPRRG